MATALLAATPALQAQADPDEAESEPSVPVAAYEQLLMTLEQRVRDRAGQNSDDESTNSDFAAMADTLSEITAVHLADGTTVPVSHSALVRALHDPKADPHAVAGQLSAQIAVLTNWRTSPIPPDALETLNSILSRPDFQWADLEQSPIRALIDRVLFAIARFFGNLVNATGSTVFFYIVAIGVLLVVLYSARNLFGSLLGEGRIAPRLAEREELTAEGALERAQHISGQGDYRTAVRYLYLATLLQLEERGILQYDRTRTNREYLRFVADRPNLAIVLYNVVDVFDRVWYGFQPLSADDYQRYQAQVETLRQQQPERKS